MMFDVNEYRELKGNEEVQIGDVIKCKGISCTVKEINFSEAWDRDGHYVEFLDTNGVYRNWKQWCDGGSVYRKKV